MVSLPFHPQFEALPRILPIFPLPGVLLLPHGKLPLTIFEPRYLAMVQDSLAWGRMFGMIQPSGPAEGLGEPPIFDTGCAGRISSFSETDDGRLLIGLTGVCRFRVLEEVEGTRGYRRVAAEWEPFRGDLEEEPDMTLDRPRLLAALRPFVKLHNMELNWKAVEGAEDFPLLIWLAMACPFEPREKQALLEAVDPTQRAQTLISLLEMAVAEGMGGAGHTRQ